MSITPFTPLGATVNLAVDTNSDVLELTTIGTGATGGMAVRLHNAGSVAVFVAFGNSAITTAATTGMPIPAGGVEVFEIGPAVTHVAAITASSTATLYATSGRGL